MSSRRLIGIFGLAVVVIVLVFGSVAVWRVWHSASEPKKVADKSVPASRHAMVEIDTNAVLADVLASISDTVERLKVPLATPLVLDKVVSFETRPVLLGRPSSLRSELIYEGGYEFRHQDSIVFEFRAPDSIRKSAEVRIPVARAGYGRERLLADMAVARASFKADLRRLGHTNLSRLDKDPSLADRLADWMDSDPPRWFLTWYGGAVVEMDAATRSLKHYCIPVEIFGREPWPTTLSHARQVKGGDSVELPAPDWSELKLEGVERDSVIALIRAVLPEAREFCAQIGPPFPTRFGEADLLLNDSTVGLSSGRIWLRLRLKSGFMISYHQGRVVGVYAPDTVLHPNYPELDGMVRRSEEYCGPIRMTGNQAVARIRDVAINRLGLPRKELWLDTEASFWRTVNPAETNGLRRYVVVWERPETDEERERRMYRRWPRETSVWGEVDAVSGELKSFVAGGAALAMPDPLPPRLDESTH
ncbi:MAG: hypothetical protein KJ072_02425 [Verrucomicrobia bacterium]|nr:hypothetical protein [Verrucomicrobiota bacterium]